MKKAVPVLSIIAFMLMLMIKPDYYLNSALRGLSLFATSVLPALFPFFFCSLVLTNIGAATTMSSMFGKPIKKLFSAPACGSYVLTMSLICGYPVGASTICSLFEQGAIDKNEAKQLISFTSTSGPMFILGTVGGAIFANKGLGAIILIAHYLSALLNGIIWRGRKKDGQNFSGEKLLSVATSPDNALGDAISSSTIAMLSVGGYIVLGNMLIDTLCLLPALSAIPVWAQSIIYGTIEMTRGSLTAQQIELLPVSAALACAIISFGGLSVILQSLAFLTKCGVRAHTLLARKFTQAILGFAICLFFGLIFLQSF